MIPSQEKDLCYSTESFLLPKQQTTKQTLLVSKHQCSSKKNKYGEDTYTQENAVTVHKCQNPLNRGRIPAVAVHWWAWSGGPRPAAVGAGGAVPQSSRGSPWCCVGGSPDPTPWRSSDVEYRGALSHPRRSLPRHSVLVNSKETLTSG